MPDFHKYTKLVTSSNSSKKIEDLSQFGLHPCIDGPSGESIELAFHELFAIPVPSKDAQIALGALEDEHGVLPTYTLSTLGGEIHFYPKPDDIDIEPYNGHTLNWLTTALSIHDDSQTVKLPSGELLLKIIPEWEESNPTQAFVDDIMAFNQGRLTITAHTEITSRKKQPPYHLGSGDSESLHNASLTAF